MLKKLLVLGVVALGCAVATVAQDNNRPNDRGDRGGRGPFGGDPAQMQERMIQGIKDRLEITDDTEWKAIQPLVEKVMTAQRQVMGDRMRGLMGRRPGGDNNRPDDRRPGMFGTPSPEAEALQRAIDGKASKAELKAATEKFVASRKTRQAELERSQAELRKVLTARQEAIATLSGLL